jgi:glycerophosphoryl diester phosphodiesterase
MNGVSAIERVPAPGVQVVAHRGSSNDAPEHTLHAYKRALDEGADALECDVRLTKDGHLVCVHDRRIDRTSNGRGILSTLELAELTELDWGSWRDTWEDLEDPEMPDRDKSQILTLRRLLETVAAAPRRVEVAIETKHPTRYAGLVERRLVSLLDEFGWAGAGSPVRIMSFSQLSLRRLRSLAPDLSSVMLFERVPLRFRDGSLPEGVGTAGPSIDVVRAHPRYVQRARRHGHPVHVWTVDAAEDIALCLELGVEAIITNRPGRVLEALGRTGGTPGGVDPIVDA